MINLGDVTFSLGADTAALLRSVDTLNRFSNTVTQTQNATTRAGAAIAASYRRQEKAAGDAFDKMQQINNTMSRMRGTEGFIRSNEAAFQRLNQTLTRGRLSALEFQRAQETFRRSLANSTTGFRELRDSAGGVIPRLKDVASGLVLVNGPLGGFATRVTALTAIMGRGGIAVAAFVAGAGAAVYTFFELGGAVVAAGRQVKSFESQFEAVTGSIVAGWKGVAQATQIARDTGQRIEDVAGGMARFRAAAEGTGMAAKTVAELFRTVAAASTKLQLGQEQTAGVFKALEQIMSKGTLQAEELRGQLGDRLPGAVQIAARAMGVTTQKLQDMMKKGLIPAGEFLPKFMAELKKTFNIDDKPIDNYTAAVNNAANAWFELRVAIDNTFSITDRVMTFYKDLTQVLDTVRTNLNSVKLYVTAVVGALAGLVAPAIIGGVISLGLAIGRMALSVGVLNAALSATPVGMFIRVALAVAGAVAALMKYKDEVYLVQGSMASLGDYGRVIWERIRNYTDTAITDMQTYFANLETPWQAVNDLLDQISKLTWDDIKKYSIQAITVIVDTFRRMLGEIQIYWNTFTNNLGVDIQRLAKVAKGIGDFFAPWTDTPVEQLRGTQKWYDEMLAGNQLVNISFEETQRQIEAFNANLKSSDAGNQFAKMLAGIHDEADKLGKTRLMQNFRQSELTGWGKELGTPGFSSKTLNQTPTLSGGGGALSDKEIKAATRMKMALENMNREIERTKEEIVALNGTEKGLQMLNEQFKREDQVRKYADAMTKAGHSAELVRAKSKELMDALELRDKLENQRKALEEWQNTLVSAFDTVAATLVDAMFDGGESMMKLPDIAKAVAKDIMNTFLQLALLNPLKNMLFGTNLPTTAGGFLGGMFGGGGGLNVFPAAPTLSSIPLRNGGISSMPFVRYARNGMLSKATKMMTSTGPVIGGEAGMEAIMPLSKDGSGRYGVDARGMGRPPKTSIKVFNTIAQDADIRVNETENSQGDQILNITVGKVFKKLAQGDADPLFASRFNMKTYPTRRG